MKKIRREMKNKSKQIGNEEHHQRKEENTKKTIGHEEHHKRNEEKSQQKQEMKKIM